MPLETITFIAFFTCTKNDQKNDVINLRFLDPCFMFTQVPTIGPTRRQINLYRMFFADFSVNSPPIFMKFCMDYLQVTRRLPWNFHRKILYS